MKNYSIYSNYAVQRIIDTWGIGRILSIQYMGKIGSSIWWHFLVTNNGEFSLYSYSCEVNEDSLVGISSTERYGGKLYHNVSHRYDMYHRLVQNTKWTKIGSKQLATEFDKLSGLKIVNAFRVIGSIIHIEFEGGYKMISYSSWKKEQVIDGKRIIQTYSSESSSHVDDAITSLLNMKISDWKLHNQSIEVQLTSKIYLTFQSIHATPALEILIRGSNDVLIFGVDTLFYSKNINIAG